MGCETLGGCGISGMSCLAENVCPGGCSFAECLQRSKLENAEGFSYRNIGSLDELFCKICTKDQLKNPVPTPNSGIYRKIGKLIISRLIEKTVLRLKFKC